MCPPAKQPRDLITLTSNYQSVTLQFQSKKYLHVLFKKSSCADGLMLEKGRDQIVTSLTQPITYGPLALVHVLAPAMTF